MPRKLDVLKQVLKAYGRSLLAGFGCGVSGGGDVFIRISGLVKAAFGH